MLSRWQRGLMGLVIVVFLGLISGPYLYAMQAASPGEVFGGFLFNPLDGNTYLAKMRVGYSGEWRYTFPYTQAESSGGYLFLLYPALGHLARLVHLDLLPVFHLARLAGALFLLAALYRFYRTTLPSGRAVWLAWILASLGSGLGWLALPFGQLTMDLWVAEAFPFLSSYANPHFPISLGLLCCLVGWRVAPGLGVDHITLPSPGRIAAGAAVLGLLLALLSPFAILVGLAVLICMSGLAFFAWQDRRSAGLWITRATGAGLGGFPLLAYYLWLTRVDPVIAQWNAQNVTPSASALDLAISLSPLIWLGLASIVWLARRGKGGSEPPNRSRLPRESQLLLVWTGLGILMAYLPFGLQRRFLLGLLIPIAGLAAWVVTHAWQAPGTSRVRLALVGMLFLAFPTNLMVIFTGLHGVQTHEPVFYLRQGEIQAFTWLAGNNPPDAVVLAAPQTSMYLPAYTGMRVVYGHPFETTYAIEREAEVQAFFQGIMEPDQVMNFLAENRVAYIFYGPRESALGGWMPASLAEPMYEQDGVAIYRYPATAVSSGMPADVH